MHGCAVLACMYVCNNDIIHRYQNRPLSQNLICSLWNIFAQKSTLPLPAQSFAFTNDRKSWWLCTNFLAFTNAVVHHRNGEFPLILITLEIWFNHAQFFIWLIDGGSGEDADIKCDWKRKYLFGHFIRQEGQSVHKAKVFSWIMELVHLVHQRWALIRKATRITGASMVTRCETS